MLQLKSINLSGYDIPRAVVMVILLVGVYAVYYAFLRFGFMVGCALALMPLMLCLAFYAVNIPAVLFLGLFVANYFLMGVSRSVRGEFPVGTVLDIFLLAIFAILVFRTLYTKVNWRYAATGLTLVAAVWLVYCLLEAVNPASYSIKAWLLTIRSYAVYFLAVVVIGQVIFDKYKYLKAILVLWSVMTILAVGKALMQKYMGFSSSEQYWLFVMGGSSTHIIHSGIRYFSFFSDAANFGASMGMSMVAFSIVGLTTKKTIAKLYYLFVAAAACYAMLISGTRSALAVPFAGYAMFILMSRQFRVMIFGGVFVVFAFVFLNFTTIGQGNAIIRRARSAFDRNDPSLVLRHENQAKLRVLMRGKPFGTGLGLGGGKSKVYGYSAINQIATDSWYVLVWVETGVVGLLLHLSILFYIICHGARLVMYRLRNSQLRGAIAALVAALTGLCTACYANELYLQIPTGLIVYTSMVFIFVSPRLDAALTADEPKRQTDDEYKA